MRGFWLLLLLLPAASAHAWVAATAASGCMDRWYTPSPDAVNVTVATDSAGIGAIAASDVHEAVVTALNTWNAVECGLCSHPGGAGCAPQVCASNPLGVTFQDGGVSPHTPWGFPCQPQPDGSCPLAPNGNYVVQVAKKADWLWGQYVASITPVVASSGTGQIVDADILFNLTTRDDGTAFTFCQSDCGNKLTAYPLCIVLTHELGHVLGMNHSLDTKATMAASATPGELYKCQLADDDKLGICTMYRTTCTGVPGAITLTDAKCEELAKANAVTPPTPAPGCQAAPGGTVAGWLLALAAIAIRLGSERSRAKST